MPRNHKWWVPPHPTATGQSRFGASKAQPWHRKEGMPIETLHSDVCSTALLVRQSVNSSLPAPLPSILSRLHFCPSEPVHGVMVVLPVLLQADK